MIGLRLRDIPRAEILVAALGAALVVCGVRLSAADSSSEDLPSVERARGQKIFTVHCARCHGMQGLGGTGPSLTRPALAENPAGLLAVIENGIPGTAMPGAWQLPKKDRQAVAAFVASLGASAEAPPTGDPSRGRTLFARAACEQCHTVAGQGGVRGPDLTEVGNRRGIARLRRMLVEPGAEKIRTSEGYVEYLPVRLTATDGREVEGLRVNEDGFTIQLRDLENRIHSFRKSEIKSVSKGFEQSIMPSFAAVFSATELDDVVAYLASLRSKK